MTEDMQAVLVRPDAPGRLALGRAPCPSCDRGETLVRVRAFSFNRGELRRAQGAPAGGRIGWDIAGVVLDAVCGTALAHAMKSLPVGGTAVVCGVTSDAFAQISLGALLGSGNASLQGFNLYHEARVEPPARGLSRLLALVGAAKLDPFITHTASWTTVGEAAEAFLGRKHLGKVVLQLDG